MADYNIHHAIHELMEIFDVEESAVDGITQEQLAEYLVKKLPQTGKRGTTPTFLKKLENRVHPELKGHFKKLYDDLKSKNVIELDSFIQLITRISDDKDMKHYLRYHKLIDKTQPEIVQPLMSMPPPPSATPASFYLRPSTASTTCDLPTQSGPSSLFTLETITHSSPDILNSQFRSIHSARSSHTSSRSKYNKDDRSRNSANLNKISKKNWNSLSYDFVTIDWEHELPVPPLGQLEVREQENVLIEDLLHVLVGIEGSYIRLEPRGERKKNSISVDDTGDKLLRTLVLRITTLCPSYSTIIHFIDEQDHGLVNQALGAAMRDLIKDYFTLIAQLEAQHRRGDLSLQKMWYYLQPCFTNMDILKFAANRIFMGNCTGGAVLSILHEKTISLTGNAKALEFCLQVTKLASEPYFEILEKWINDGIIYDPFKEFFIEDVEAKRDEDVVIDPSDDLYWENRYKEVKNRMPVFLERFAERILKTGKYLSVIRQCGKQVSQPRTDELLVYTTEERVYTERIETAYCYASKELLHLLLRESDLIGHINSVKHYFLMDQGDFIVQFMDMAEDELAKNIDDIVPTRLDALLELALRTSILNSDPHKDDVNVELKTDTVLKQMSKILTCGGNFGNSGDQSFDVNNLMGYEALAFNYKVEWPLSLILNKRSIACYQMIFRHMFYCKYVERMLQTVWQDNKVAKHFALKAITQYAEAYALRQKMLNFVQNLQYYMMVEIIEPNFHAFITKVNTKVSSVDDMIIAHTDFIEICLRDCMMTQQFALHQMVKLLQLCMEFSKFMQETHRHSAQFELQGASDGIVKAYEFSSTSDEQSHAKGINKSFQQTIAEMHSNFNQILMNLFQEVSSQQKDHYAGNILQFFYRLDFNGFYTRNFEEQCRLDI